MNKREKFLIRAFLRWNRKEIISKSCFCLKLQSSFPESALLNQAVVVDEQLLRYIPKEFYSISNENEFKLLIGYVFRTLPRNDSYLTNGMDILKQLNNYRIRLQKRYSDHVFNSNISINDKASFKLGQVCVHEEQGYRGVVVGWEINTVTNIQDVHLLVDSMDFYQFLPASKVSEESQKEYNDIQKDDNKVRIISSKELNLVMDDQLLRITHDSISDYFIKFDLKLKRFIPKMELLFCYPYDFHRTDNRMPNIVYSENKDKMDTQIIRDQVNHTISKLCDYLYSVIELYDIPPQSVDKSQNADSSSDSLYNLLYDVISVIDEIKYISSLPKNSARKSYQNINQFKDFPLWKPYNNKMKLSSELLSEYYKKSLKAQKSQSKSSLSGRSHSEIFPPYFSSSKFEYSFRRNRSMSNSFYDNLYQTSLISNNTYYTLSQLSYLYTQIDQILFFRLQKYGISYLDDLQRHYNANSPNSVLDYNFIHSKSNKGQVNSNKFQSDMSGNPTNDLRPRKSIKQSNLSVSPYRESMLQTDSSSSPEMVMNSQVNPASSVSNGNKDVKTLTRIKPSFNQANTPAFDKCEVIDTTHTPKLLFSVGQIVRHVQFKYRAVIFGWDQRPQVDVSRWLGVASSNLKSDQPFYRVLPDTDDLETYLGPGRSQTDFYVAQENLELIPISTYCPIYHPKLKEYFKGYDPKSGEFKVSNKIQFLFPRNDFSEYINRAVEASLSGINAINHREKTESMRKMEKILVHIYFTLKTSFSRSREESLNVSKLSSYINKNRSPGSNAVWNSRTANKNLRIQTSPLESKEDIPVLSFFNLIQLLQRAETLEEAHQLESLILNINSANRNPSVNKAMRLGSWCLKRGLIDDATAYFKQANSLDMDYTEALTKLSVLYNQMGHHSKCIYWSNIISQRSPFQYNALTGLAVSLEKLGREIEAERVIRNVLSIYPWYYHLCTVLQSSLFKRKQNLKLQLSRYHEKTLNIESSVSDTSDHLKYSNNTNTSKAIGSNTDSKKQPSNRESDTTKNTTEENMGDDNSKQ